MKLRMPRHGRTGRMIKQAGFTLVELLIVVGVVAVMAGLWKGGPYLQGWWSGQGEAQQMVSAINCMTSQTSSTSFGSTTIATMVNNNCFPDTQTGYGTAGASATNSVGSTYAVAAVTLTGGATNGALQLASPSIPSKACNSLVKKLQVAGMQQILVGSTTVYDSSAGTALSDTTLGTACGAATSATIYAARSKSGT